MKAILEFNMPEDMVEHHDALHGTDWKLVLMDLETEMRSAIRYGHAHKTADEAIDHFRTRLFEIVTDKGLLLE